MSGRCLEGVLNVSGSFPEGVLKGDVEPILWLHTKQMVAGIKLLAVCITIKLAPLPHA